MTNDRNRSVFPQVNMPQQKTADVDVDQAVNDLFDNYPINDILGALAERCLAESAIVRGEGRPQDSHAWQRAGEEILEVVVELRCK